MLGPLPLSISKLKQNLGALTAASAGGPPTVVFE